jgi:uncharacterized membrane protein YqjE
MAVTIREAVGGLIATRFALFGLELRDELDRVAVMVGLAIATAFLLIMGLCFLGLAILFGFWAYRILVCTIIAAMFLGFGVLAWIKVRKLMHIASDPFPLTSEEFAQDKQLIEAAFTQPEDAAREAQ